MLGEEQPGQAQPLPQGPVRESDLVAEPGVALEQQMVVIGGEAGNGSGCCRSFRVSVAASLLVSACVT
jgi:hypothetical protein